VEHLQHFDLSQDPFQNEPDLRFYFDSANHRDVQVRLERGLRQHKGLCVLTGEGGTGKTLLARKILDALEEEMFDANLMVMLAGAADAESVLSRFARQVGVEAPAGDRSVLLAQLYEQLAIVREDGRHCVLILDDAQILPRVDIAQVSGLLNLEYEDRRLLSLLLVGLPELDVTISHDSSLAQRVDVRIQLLPFDVDNAAAYLRHRLGIVGGRPETFAEDAIEALFKFSRGRPRLLNTLADNSLFEAFLDGRKQVSGSHVERAAGDLGIGADPGTTYQGISTPPSASSASIGSELTDSLSEPALLLSEVAPTGDEGEADFGALLDAAGSSDEVPSFGADGGGSDTRATEVAFLDDSDPSSVSGELDDLFVELVDD
jgi:type II secretory pathway predicted ATPase ExeA